MEGLEVAVVVYSKHTMCDDEFFSFFVTSYSSLSTSTVISQGMWP